jgi:hypothetical protein
MPNPGVFACSRPGTEGSNPSLSSGESVANLWHNRKTLDQDDRIPKENRHTLEPEGGEPRAAVLHSASFSEIFDVSPERLASGEVVFLGVIEERAHFARRSTCCVPRRWPLRVSRPRRSGSPICARSGHS